MAKQLKTTNAKSKATPTARQSASGPIIPASVTNTEELILDFGTVGPSGNEFCIENNLKIEREPLPNRESRAKYTRRVRQTGMHVVVSYSIDGTTEIPVSLTAASIKYLRIRLERAIGEP